MSELQEHGHGTHGHRTHGHGDDTELERRRELRDRRTHDVVELISRRGELEGINPWADLVRESVAWTA